MYTDLPIENILNPASHSSSSVIHVVLRALSSIDTRLIEHGERVAFIIYEMLPELSLQEDIDQQTLLLLALLHDLGAYKTEEINHLLRFETGEALPHTVYGYLFFKYFTQLKPYADIILYHHTSYPELAKSSCSYKAYTQLLFFADRVDILLRTGQDLHRIQQNCHQCFHPYLPDRFFQAEKKRHITARILTGQYKEVIYQQISAMHFTNQEILEFLNLLVYAMDFRSPHTVAHTANTTTISLQLGMLMQLDDQDLQNLYYGAIFHDLGKISIPVTILEKAGALTNEEMKTMRTHVEKTDAILRGIVSDKVCDIAIRHHEKLDGSGYPQRLTAKELTLTQRIVAVADILSALCGKRSYKDRFPKEKILQILNQMVQSGQLCPNVCAALFANYDSIHAKTQQTEQAMQQLYQKIHQQYADITRSNPLLTK